MSRKDTLGRADLLRCLEGLRYQSNCVGVNIVAPHGMGKSSLANVLSFLAYARFTGSIPIAQTLGILSDKLRNRMDIRTDGEEGRNFPAVLRGVYEACDAHQWRRPIIILDEAFTDPDAAGFYETLRDLAMSRPWRNSPLWVFLEPEGWGGERKIANDLSILRMDPLSRSHVLAYCARPRRAFLLGALEIHFTAPAARRVWEATRGYPLFFSLLRNWMRVYRGDQGEDLAEPIDEKEVLEVLQHGGTFNDPAADRQRIEYSLNRAHPTAFRILNTLAWREEEIPIRMLKDVLREEWPAWDVPRDEIARRVDILCHQGLLRRGRGKIQLGVPMLASTALRTSIRAKNNGVNWIR